MTNNETTEMNALGTTYPLDILILYFCPRLYQTYWDKIHPIIDNEEPYKKIKQQPLLLTCSTVST